MALQLSDKEGVLGHVWLQDGQLTGDNPSAQQLADKYQARYGADAYAELAKLDNGYVRASEYQ